MFGTDSGDPRPTDQVRRNFRALLRRAAAQLRFTLSDHGIPIEVIARAVITEEAEALDDIFEAPPP
ncbi:hypothetical protein [Streptomyces sp. CB03238]|uniref:hypothetical protein n=1 Tax=Streptomyces sp. CB03238 TaxID=1907777 RepID=UPI00117CCE5D|nr:hypothetical protein [Streptomyces sp. CB03238]